LRSRRNLFFAAEILIQRTDVSLFPDTLTAKDAKKDREEREEGPSELTQASIPSGKSNTLDDCATCRERLCIAGVKTAAAESVVSP